MSKKKIFENPKLGRKAATRDLRPIIYIFCEGAVTEPQYLISFYRHLKRKLTVMPKPRGGEGEPLTIVQTCIDFRDVLKRAEPSKRWKVIDQVWAVFDRDIHDRFDAAVALAKANNVNLAISNPCIEVWGLLHGEEPCNKPMGRHEAQKAVKAVFPDYDHDDNPVFDWARCEEVWRRAADNAIRGLRSRVGEGNPFPTGNPSSNFHCLLLALCGREKNKDHERRPNVRGLDPEERV
ncbi:RloB family protein [Burkholderia stagnalis]|uniref:RloB family protein n=1 Tax=Burkholderia stagnalis TaxID=1503054 RepID=UPI0009C1154F|nr:RloB family protein [Burkholderia stagnalis]